MKYKQVLLHEYKNIFRRYIIDEVLVYVIVYTTIWYFSAFLGTYWGLTIAIIALFYQFIYYSDYKREKELLKRLLEDKK